MLLLLWIYSAAQIGVQLVLSPCLSLWRLQAVEGRLQLLSYQLRAGGYKVVITQGTMLIEFMVVVLSRLPASWQAACENGCRPACARALARADARARRPKQAKLARQQTVR